jgi:SAM-dependent methyltransferase
MNDTNRTRGFGVFEKFLSSRRARVADKLIPRVLRKGSLLDIGCGPYPYFLTHSEFNVKVGIDQECGNAGENPEGITIRQWDVGKNRTLPFDNGFFDAVTMLAVIEHLQFDALVSILDEIHRVMKPGGCLIMTSPSFWTPPLLFALSRIGLISKLEIDDHKHAYSLKELSRVIGKSLFSSGSRVMGYFECGMNMWARVTK